MENQTKVKKGGVTDWFRALIGKPKVEVPTQPEPSESKLEVLPEMQEDSIVQDIESLKSFVKNVGTVKKKVASGKGTGLSVAQAPGGMANKPILKNIIRISLIVFFLFLLIFIGIKILKLTGGKNNGGTNIQPTISTIPSPAPYVPHNPSVYANDPEVLKLEEDILVLERELSNTNVREDRLFPPTLDYNVRF